MELQIKLDELLQVSLLILQKEFQKDKSKFINIAYSTSIEVINFLILSWDLDFISEEEYIELREKTELITNQLNSFYKSLE